MRIARTIALPCLLVAAAGCLDLDALRDRAGNPDAGDLDAGSDMPDTGTVATCEGDDRSAIRFWKLHLGQSDYVTLKNTADCAIELGGLRLVIDDLDERMAMPGDCEVQLPALRLQPNAEVRVHEDPLPGDISFLDNTLDECPADFSFNPERGGVTYLCDGACSETTVIDVITHIGEKFIPPQMRYGQTFDAPLDGITVANQEARQFRRVATEGHAPSFLNSDWRLETRYVYASFEDAVEVLIDDTAKSFAPEDGQSATFSTSEIAAVGNVSLSLAQRASDGRSAGLALMLPKAGRTPTHVSYFARMDELPAAGAYFDLQSGAFSAIQGSFEKSSVGTEIENGKRTDVLGAEMTWHQIEFRNVDWADHTYDLYVDRVLVAAETPFWSNALSADKLSLYSVTGGTTAYWDEIELWRDDEMPVFPME